jgi:hypothetical protein
VFDTVSEHLGVPMPPPGINGPFALDDRQRLESLFADDFAEVDVQELETPLHAATFDEWWSRTRALAGPLATIVASLPAESFDQLTARLQQATEPYRTARGLDFPGVNLIAFGRARGHASG